MPELLSALWADETGKFHYYDREQAQHGIQRVTPRGALWGRRAYVQEKAHGDDRDTPWRDDSVEVYVGQQIEAPFQPVLSGIVSSLRQGKNPELTRSERDTLNRFFFCQFCRSSGHLSDVFPPELIQHIVNVVRDRIEALRPLEPEEESFLSPSPTLSRVVKNAAIQLLARPADDAIKILDRAGLMFRIARPGSFILASDPIIGVPDPEGRKLGEGQSMFILPIAPDLAVLYGPRSLEGSVLCVADALAIDRLNVAAVSQSQAFVGCSRQQTEVLRDYAGTAFRNKFLGARDSETA